MHRPPLAGRRVIELGTMLAAPFAGNILSQLGAEVIKVEPPVGDPTRTLVRGGPSGTFIAYSHGKKSVCIDLSKPEGHSAFCQLLRTADALVHNLSPKAARKLKVTHQDCATINRRLICCHIRGYGAGPLEEELASNPVAEASTGVMEGNRVNGRPSRLGPSYHDQFAGAYAVIGLLASMLQPQEGDARHVEVGLYETGLHVAARDLVGVQLKTQLLGKPEREPHGEFSMPGYGAYQTSDGRWLYLLLLNDTHWHRFWQGMGLPADESLATVRLRRRARERVEQLVSAAIAAHSFDTAAARLKTAEVGFTEVLPLERVLDTPQARHPGKLRRVEFRRFEFAVPEFPGLHARDARLSTQSPPDLGEHTQAVLAAAGIDRPRYQALLRSGAVAETSPGAFAWVVGRHDGRTANPNQDVPGSNSPSDPGEKP